MMSQMSQETGFKWNNTSKLNEDLKKENKKSQNNHKTIQKRANFELRDKAEKCNGKNYLDKS